MPLRIETRVGKDNTVADYLSRKPHQDIDEEVNIEDKLEEKVYRIRTRETLQKRIERNQRDPAVTPKLLFLDKNDSRHPIFLSRMSDVPTLQTNKQRKRAYSTNEYQ